MSLDAELRWQPIESIDDIMANRTVFRLGIKEQTYTEDELVTFMRVLQGQFKEYTPLCDRLYDELRAEDEMECVAQLRNEQLVMAEFLEEMEQQAEAYIVELAAQYADGDD